MPTVRYTALRSLYGAGSGDTVVLELPAKYAGMTVSKKTYGTTRVSMSGARERYHERAERVYSITTKPMPEDLYRKLRMFLDSVERSEAFSFSPDASAFATAYLDTLDYDESLHPDLDKLRTTSFAIVVP